MAMNDEFLNTSSLVNLFDEQNVNSAGGTTQFEDYSGNKQTDFKLYFENIKTGDGSEVDLQKNVQIGFYDETSKRKLIIRPTSLSLKTSNEMNNKEEHLDDVTASLDEGFSLLSCQEKICDLYMRLHEPGSEEALNLLGTVILSFIDDIKQIMSEKNHLETLYNKSQEQHSEQVKHLEEEIEAQMSRVEERVQQEVQKKIEVEKKNLTKKHKQELVLLQTEMSKLREAAASANSNADKVDKLMSELEQSDRENEELNRTAAELNENLTIMRDELSNFQRKLEEKEVELIRQKKIALEDCLEIDNLVTQVNLLQSANKTLHEKTDDLCEALRICRSYYKAQMKQKAIMTKDDFIQKYLDESCATYSRSISREPQTIEMKSIKTSSSGFGDNEADDLESCQSAMEDVTDLDNINSISDYNSGHERRSDMDSGVISSNQEPERVYKIVLAGDAAVGKSSFIMRLCKNKFVSSLNSTVGVDFQTKTLKVDGKVIALQLWDTAGQERFRSIAKSYFRRADGVLLLYDVSYERSFLNVRDWIEVIQDGAQKSIPVMIVGNKSDLRDEPRYKSSCLKFEDGLNLAKSFESLFVETSAKSGSNISQAIIELSRALMAREDLEVRSVGLSGLKLKDTEVKKSSLCC